MGYPDKTSARRSACRSAKREGAGSARRALFPYAGGQRFKSNRTVLVDLARILARLGTRVLGGRDAGADVE